MPPAEGACPGTEGWPCLVRLVSASVLQGEPASCSLVERARGRAVLQGARDAAPQGQTPLIALAVSTLLTRPDLLSKTVTAVALSWLTVLPGEF